MLSFLPLSANAAQLTPRSLTLGTSATSTATTHQYNFTVATTANIGSIGFVYCTAPSGTCTMPAGLSTTAASLSAQSGATGFTINNTTNGSPYITRTAASVTAGTAVSFTLSNVTNPSAANTSFYVRIQTYTGTDGATGPTDFGTVAASTANQITFQGTVDEALTFCVGVTVTSTCSSTTGTAASFSPSSTFSRSTTTTASSQFAAATNASTGYSITYTGNTLMSGSNAINAAQGGGTTAASTTGTSQFGLNLIDAHFSGQSVGQVAANYATGTQYRFASGDTLATSQSQPTDFDTYTANYIVNISAITAAGRYTTTLTFICTASF